MNKSIFFLLLVIISISLVSSITVNDALIRSDGLNSTINVSNFSISFSKLEVFSNAITFTNLNYTNPLSCSLKASSYSVYNFTSLNTNTELPKESCTTTPSADSGGATSSPIYLSNIKVNFSDNWTYGKKNYIYVNTYNNSNNLSDVNKVEINIINNLTYEESEVYRTGIGKYYKWFIVYKENKNITEEVLFFNITVSELTKTVSNTYNVTISGKSNFLDVPKKYVRNIFEKTKDFLINNWLISIITVVLIIAIVVFFEIFFRKKK